MVCDASEGPCATDVEGHPRYCECVAALAHRSLARPRHARALALVVGLCALAAESGCANRKDPRCGRRSATECAWDDAVGAGRPGETRDDDEVGWFDPRLPTRTPTDEWTRATEILGEAWTLMGEGVEGKAVSVQAQKWCDPQRLNPGPDGRGWVCDMLEAPELGGREARLEFGREGVVALTMMNLGEGEAAKLLADAAERWGSLCSGGAFETMPARGAEGSYEGCVLKDGPLLVLSRFVPDAEAKLWQVSLSVMPAG